MSTDDASSRRLALLITTSRHDDPALGVLNGLAADARSLAAVLRDPALGGFETQLLTNRTSGRVQEALEDFFLGSDFGDVLLLYFTGHGLRADENELYLAARNTRQSKLRSTAIPAGFLSKVMRRSRSQSQVVILDCCYGGLFDAARTLGDEKIDIAEDLSGSGTVVLTASTATEFSWLEDQEPSRPPRSVYTGILVEGLRSGAADVDRDGKITPTDIHRYVSRKLKERDAAQTPTISSQHQQGDLLVARAPLPLGHWPADVLRELPDAVTDLAEHSDPSLRVKAVDLLRGYFGAAETPKSLAAVVVLERLRGDASYLVASAAAEVHSELRTGQAALAVPENTSSSHYKTDFFREQHKRVLPIPPPRVIPPRMSLNDVLDDTHVKAIESSGKISFHAVGDTGRPPTTVASPVSGAMVTDIENATASGPSFCFLVGDVVVYFGEAKYYYEQFYEPFRDYQRPIFAIPGNHDGVLTGPDAVSLAAFLTNFCASASRRSPDGRGSARTTMKQPGVYFTLDVPFVSIIGLYTNVLEGPGVISSEGGRFPALDDQQLEFLTHELKRLRPARLANQRAVLIACHHPPLPSPGGSLLSDIDAACGKAKLWPDAVLFAHAHVYRRFTRHIGGRSIPYVMAGTGGGRLRRLQQPESPPYEGLAAAHFDVAPRTITSHGYLVVGVDTCDNALTLTIEFRNGDGIRKDAVSVDLRTPRTRTRPPR